MTGRMANDTVLEVATAGETTSGGAPPSTARDKVAEDNARQGSAKARREAVTVHFYEPRDRAGVMRVCADTGFLGGPIDHVFEDRELFAEYLMAYHTDVEPDLMMVCELDGRIMGYVAACSQPRFFKIWSLWNNLRVAAVGAWRYFTRPYGPATREFAAWALASSSGEIPDPPENTPHFHFNVVPGARSVAVTRSMVDRIFERLAERGAKAVYAQMVGYEDRRTVRTLERYGFQVLNRSKVSKFRKHTDKTVYSITIIKDLTKNVSLYGLDLHLTRRKADSNGGSGTPPKSNDPPSRTATLSELELIEELKGMGIELRQATNADRDEIEGLVFSTLAEYGLRPSPEGTDSDLQDIEQNYIAPGGIFDVLVSPADNNLIVGTVGLMPKGDGVCELRKMYLLKKWRRRGIGKRMLVHSLNRARELGFHRINLETAKVLSEATGLYRRYGFQECAAEGCLSKRCDLTMCLEL